MKAHKPVDWINAAHAIAVIAVAVTAAAMVIGVSTVWDAIRGDDERK